MKEGDGIEKENIDKGREGRARSRRYRVGREGECC